MSTTQLGGVIGRNCFKGGSKKTSWWLPGFNPFIFVNLDHFPKYGVKIKYVWNHHTENHATKYTPKRSMGRTVHYIYLCYIVHILLFSWFQVGKCRQIPWIQWAQIYHEYIYVQTSSDIVIVSKPTSGDKINQKLVGGSTHLKIISQIGSCPEVGVKMKKMFETTP